MANNFIKKIKCLIVGGLESSWVLGHREAGERRWILGCAYQGWESTCTREVSVYYWNMKLVTASEEVESSRARDL